MTEVMTDQAVAYVWSDGDEYDDTRCSVDVSRPEGHEGGADVAVYVDGQGAKIQLQFSREGALAMAEAFLRVART